LKLRRDDAVADKHRFGLYLGECLLHFAVADPVRQPAQFGGGAAAGHLEGCGVERLHPGELEVLKVGAVISGWLRARQRELRGNVLGGEIAAAGSHAATFEKIARQQAGMRGNALRLNCFGLARQSQGPKEHKGESKQAEKRVSHERTCALVYGLP
jgi:hypothetical protein